MRSCLVTLFSLPALPVHFVFFGDAYEIYGDSGLIPATEGAVGLDLRVCLDADDGILIPPGERRMVHTGIGVEPCIPYIAGFVYSRSGLGALKGITVAQGVGVIDPDYRGEITVPLLNTSAEAYTVAKGERIAQLIFQPYFRPEFTRVDALSATRRGGGGFGHTGAV